MAVQLSLIKDCDVCGGPAHPQIHGVKIHCVPRKPAPTVRPAIQQDLIDHWAFIRRGLLKIKKRMGGHSYWEPEHIHAALTGGRASLLVIERGDRMVGFIVTTVQIDPFLQIPLCLYVWIAYSEGGGVAEGHAYLEEQARRQGLRYLEASTLRKGLERRMARHGWYESMRVLRKDLYDGRS